VSFIKHKLSNRK